MHLSKVTKRCYEETYKTRDRKKRESKELTKSHTMQYTIMSDISNVETTIPPYTGLSSYGNKSNILVSSSTTHIEWSDVEDSVLRDAVLKCGEQWEQVRQHILTEMKEPVVRTVEEYEHRWTNTVSRKHKKGPWTEDEDRLVCHLVKINGPKKWSTLSVCVPGRTGKQCRERWVNHLSPEVNKGEWSEEEEQILIEEHARLGNQWCKIAQHLPGRSENAVKNRWNSFANRSAIKSEEGIAGTIKAGKSKAHRKRLRTSKTKNMHTYHHQDMHNTHHRQQYNSEAVALKVLHSLSTNAGTYHQDEEPSTITNNSSTNLHLTSSTTKELPSMLSVRRRLSKPLFVNPSLHYVHDHIQDPSTMTEFDSILLNPELSPAPLCISPPAMLSPISPRFPVNGHDFASLSSLWPTSPALTMNRHL